MILKPNPVSTKQFHYNKATSTFSADISDTNGLGRVYDDACDEGLTLVSHRTGEERVFVLTGEEWDGEGDVRWWELESLDGQYKMLLWND